jgi:predicted nucleic acid-binding Zn ribbon protein
MTDDHASAVEAFQRAVRASSAAQRPAGRRRPRPRSGGSREPQPLGSAIGDLMAEQGWEQDARSANVVEVWADLVGADIAAHVSAVSCTAGVLLVQAESTAWATQVRLLTPQLRAILDEALGTDVVTQIDVQGPAAPSWVKGPRRVPGRGPRDTYG